MKIDQIIERGDIMDFELSANIPEKLKEEVLEQTKFMDNVLEVMKKNYSNLLTDLEEIDVDTDRFYIEIKMKYDDYENGFTMKI